MARAAENLQFEKAAEYRDQLRAVNRIVSKQKVIAAALEEEADRVEIGHEREAAPVRGHVGLRVAAELFERVRHAPTLPERPRAITRTRSASSTSAARPFCARTNDQAAFLSAISGANWTMRECPATTCSAIPVSSFPDAK